MVLSPVPRRLWVVGSGTLLGSAFSFHAPYPSCVSRSSRSLVDGKIRAWLGLVSLPRWENFTHSTLCKCQMKYSIRKNASCVNCFAASITVDTDTPAATAAVAMLRTITNSAFLYEIVI